MPREHFRRSSSLLLTPAMRAAASLVAILAGVTPAIAHPPEEHDHAGTSVLDHEHHHHHDDHDLDDATGDAFPMDPVRAAALRAAIVALHQPASSPIPPATASGLPWQATSFGFFAPFVTVRTDDRWLFVESDGLPHPPLEFTMMKGIRTWQQQVPLPQPYRGANAWQIPLRPVLAADPVSARTHLRRGAIALAANGIPIFNALNNRGADSLAIGELDEFGGHCGRADDYHYHAAPLALQAVVGRGNPIAWGLDGLPIYGLFDPKAPAGSDLACPLGSTEPLDEFNGHFCVMPAGRGFDGGTRGYHYHASTTYPYINGGMRGEVTVEDDQIMPQPRAQPVRQWTTPLRGARITGFEKTGDLAWRLTYAVSGATSTIAYRVLKDGQVEFVFTDPEGDSRTELFSPRREGGGGGRGGEGDADRERRPGGGGRNQPQGESPPRRGDAPPATPAAGDPRAFSIVCGSLDAQGLLSVDCTCDGAGESPELSWSNLPAGTRSVALSMHATTPDGEERVYLVRWGIPAETTSLPEGDRSIGRFGTNSVSRRAEYAPPCSQGPGVKTYVVTLHALSAVPSIEGEPTREALRAAIKDSTIATATLDLRAERKGLAPGGAPAAGGAQGGGRRGGGGQRSRGDAPSGDGQGGAPEGAPTGGQGAGRGGDGDQAPRSGQGRRGGGGQGGGQGGAPGEGAQDATNPPGAPASRGRSVDGSARGTEGSLIARMTAFKTEVPSRDHDLILVQPTETSIGVSVLVASDREGAIEWWSEGSPPRRTPMTRLEAGDPTLVRLEGLEPDRAYAYRLLCSIDGAAPTPSAEHRFHTPRAEGSPFTFVIQADSHLDQGVEPAMYERTLANMLEARPDFLVDLGDTFMTDKRGGNFRTSLAQYDAQRWYFSRLCHSAPLFMVLGNHDGEKGESGTRPDDMGPWSYAERSRRFPPPAIEGSGGMYSGDTAFAGGRGSNHYAFTWGDALIIVLDPFWSTTERIRGGSGGGDRGARGGGSSPRPEGGEPETLEPTDASWVRTLGREQYDWLARTLEASDARHRFVFIHHLVGGLGGPESRGGAESSVYFEWGGRNADGSPGFAEHRPGWPMPIHDLLVKHGVSAVFHGHDHLYVHSTRDGVHYQCVPQPGNPAGNVRSAVEYGYASGTILGSPGHLRVTVGPGPALVEFVRSALDAPRGDPPDAARPSRRGRSGSSEPNGAVVDRYEIPARVE